MTEQKRLSEEELKNLEEVAKKVRENILVMINAAKSGHTGGSLSPVELLLTLYEKCMTHYKEWDKSPEWENRDRFILSKGHASATLYATLAQMGYFDEQELLTFRKLGTRLQGHPTYGLLPGIEVSTGSLGQGLSMANGIALGLKLDKKKNQVFVLLGDGEIQEGQVWEAAMTSAHYKMDNLIAIIDRNRLQIDGDTEQVKTLDPLDKKWEAFGWQVLEIDGHDFQEICGAIEHAKELGKQKSAPVMIIANTIKGKGVTFTENQASWHGKPMNDEELQKALQEIRG